MRIQMIGKMVFEALVSIGAAADPLTAAGPRTYPGPGGYTYSVMSMPRLDSRSLLASQRFWDGYAWRERRVRICG